MKLGAAAALLAALLVSCAGLGALVDDPQPTPTIPPAATATPTLDLPVAPRVGALAPEVTLSALDGETVTLSDYRGKLVLLNFWTTW